MAYVKFNNSDSAVECTVIPHGENVVTMQFSNTVIVNTSGFRVYLDKDMEYDIGGNFYENFITVYKNDEETSNFNGYQLSNDGSVWIAPVIPEKEPEPIPSQPTEEEIAAQELQNKIYEVQNQIWQLKTQLESTDYIIIKAYEASLVGEVITEYDFESIHAERQSIRDEINMLEIELTALLEQQEEILHG